LIWLAIDMAPSRELIVAVIGGTLFGSGFTIGLLGR
jgi:hypothetical protein